MSTKVKSDVQAFNLVVEKFAARWKQLKPKDNLPLDSIGRKSTAVVMASLQEWRKEFDDLVSTSSHLKLVNVY